MLQTNRVRMARKPQGTLALSDYQLEEITLPAPKAGEVLCKAHYISLDPYLAGPMLRREGPQPEWSEGIIVGRMVGQVIESCDPAFSEGDWVTGENHWQDFELTSASNLQKITLSDQIPASVYLGLLGSSGLTAWIGVRKIIDIQPGEILTISSAAGGVGAIAGQLARAQGARVIGIAGGPAKCREVVEELGFDHCIDYRQADFHQQLASAVPEGIDAHFENVGATVLDPILPLMKDLGRIGLCGLIAHYLDDAPISLNHFRSLLTKGLQLTGFRVFDHLDDAPQAQIELIAAIADGQLSIRETITEGLENAPQAYLNMLAGLGTGKHLISLKQ